MLRSRLSLLLVAALVTASCADDGADVPITTTTTAPTTGAAEPDPAPATTEAVTTTTEPPGVAEPVPLPRPRTEVAGTLWEGMIVVLGGLLADGSAAGDVDAYDPVPGAWSRLPDLPEPLHHTALGVLDGRLYVVGGYAIEGGRWAARSAVWSLGAGEAEWRPEPALLAARGALAVAWDGDRLVAVGGVGAAGVLASTEILDSGSTGWVPGPELAQAREHLAATAVDGEVYAIAGRVGGLDGNLASVEVLRDGAWHAVPDLNHARSGIGAAVVAGMPCVAGGEERGGTIGSVECLVAGSWLVVAVLEVPRHGLAVVAVEDRLHVIGGGPVPGLTVSDAHEVIAILRGG